MQDSGQSFPLYWYERQDGTGLFAENVEYVRHDAITPATLATFRAAYGEVDREDIFHYIYGLLHSPEYRQRYAVNLKKSLPRIPLTGDFAAFRDAGSRLAELHTGYETVEPWPLAEITTVGASKPSFRVQKLRHPKVAGDADRSVIIVNDTLCLSGIPDEAYRYEVNGQSAIWWLMDRYRVTTDKESGIVNDPNDWSQDPRYIVSLIGSVVRVSMETMAIVDSLPPLNEKAQ